MRIVVMDDQVPITELFQEIVSDHGRKPRNVGCLQVPPARHGKAVNPLCGDEVEVWTLNESEILADVVFKGQGCSISQASASLMTVKLKGKPVAEVLETMAKFEKLMAGEINPTASGLGNLELFAVVRKFPARIVCATLAWQALRKAIESQF